MINYGYTVNPFTNRKIKLNSKSAKKMMNKMMLGGSDSETEPEQSIETSSAEEASQAVSNAAQSASIAAEQSNKALDDLKTQNQNLSSKINDLQKENEGKNNEIESLKNDIQLLSDLVEDCCNKMKKLNDDSNASSCIKETISDVFEGVEEEFETEECKSTLNNIDEFHSLISEHVQKSLQSLNFVIREKNLNFKENEETPEPSPSQSPSQEVLTETENQTGGRKNTVKRSNNKNKKRNSRNKRNKRSKRR